MKNVEPSLQNHQMNPKIPPLEMTQAPRINMTRILSLVTQQCHSPKIKECIREGFESFMQNYDGTAPPFTIDENGDYWTWPDAVIFILDHMPPSYHMISIKRQLISGTINFETCDELISSGRQFTNCIVTGVDTDADAGNYDGDMIKDAKKTFDMFMSLVNSITRILRLR